MKVNIVFYFYLFIFQKFTLKVHLEPFKPNTTTLVGDLYNITCKPITMSHFNSEQNSIIFSCWSQRNRKWDNTNNTQQKLEKKR